MTGTNNEFHPGISCAEAQELIDHYRTKTTQPWATEHQTYHHAPHPYCSCEACLRRANQDGENRMEIEQLKNRIKQITNE